MEYHPLATFIRFISVVCHHGLTEDSSPGRKHHTFISRRRELPRSSQPVRSFPRHSGMQTGLLGLVPVPGCPAATSSVLQRPRVPKRGKCGAGDPAERLLRIHCAPDWPLALLGRLPCGGRCSLTFGLSPPLPFAPSLPLPTTVHRTWSP